MNNQEENKQNEFVAYLRVSSQKQLKNKDGLSLDEQRASISARVASEGGRIVAEFIEIQSAWVQSRIKGKTRVILNKAIELCKSNNYTLIVSHTSRFARDVEFALSVQNSGVDIAIADMPNIDKFTFVIYCSIYQKQSDDASRKILAVKSLQREKGMKLGWYEQHTHSDNKAAGLSAARTRCYRFFLEPRTIKLHQLLTGYSEMYEKAVLTKMDYIQYPKRMFIEKDALKNILKHINKFEREVFELEEGEVFEQKHLRYLIDQMKRNSKCFRRFFGENATIQDAELQFYTVSPQDLVDEYNKDPQNEINAAKRREYVRKAKIRKEQEEQSENEENVLSIEQKESQNVSLKNQKDFAPSSPSLMQEYINKRISNNQETTATL